MTGRSLCLILAVLSLFAVCPECRGAAPPRTIENLIDALVSVQWDEDDESTWFHNSDFMPLHREQQFLPGTLACASRPLETF